MALTGTLAVGPTIAGAKSHHVATAPVHTGCADTWAGSSSGWCGLYPGGATGNVKDQASVTVVPNGSSMTITTQSLSSGTTPQESFACLSSVPADLITHRLQHQQCSAVHGMWYTWSTPSFTIHMEQCLYLYGGQVLSLQVGANDKAGNANGAAFYNGFTVYDIAEGF